MKKYEVAILVDKKGNTIGALKCKMCDEKEYKELISKTALVLSSKDKQIEDLTNQVGALSKSIGELLHEIRVLKGEE